MQSTRPNELSLTNVLHDRRLRIKFRKWRATPAGSSSMPVLVLGKIIFVHDLDTRFYDYVVLQASAWKPGEVERVGNGRVKL